MKTDRTTTRPSIVYASAAYVQYRSRQSHPSSVKIGRASARRLLLPARY